MLASAVFAKGTNASLAGPLRFIFCHFDRPISLGSFQNYRRETLHAQVPPEVLTQTSLQWKNPQFQASLLSERRHPIPPRLRERKMEKQAVPCAGRPGSQEAAMPFKPLDSAPRMTGFRHPKEPLMHLNNIVRIDGKLRA
jgi:hypothetical protein